jgi:hypothetical protein
MPTTEPIAVPDEPKEALDEILRTYGASATLRALARSLRQHRLELRDSGEPFDIRRAVGRAASRAAQSADDIDIQSE